MKLNMMRKVPSLVVIVKQEQSQNDPKSNAARLRNEKQQGITSLLRHPRVNDEHLSEWSRKSVVSDISKILNAEEIVKYNNKSQVKCNNKNQGAMSSTTACTSQSNSVSSERESFHETTGARKKCSRDEHWLSLPIGRPLAAAPTLVSATAGTVVFTNEHSSMGQCSTRKRKSLRSFDDDKRSKAVCIFKDPVKATYVADDTVVDAAVALSNLSAAAMPALDRRSRSMFLFCSSALPPPPFRLVDPS